MEHQNQSDLAGGNDVLRNPSKAQRCPKIPVKQQSSCSGGWFKCVKVLSIR